MRIIAGTARGTVLETLAGDCTRPTLGRVKENFFNAINFELEGKKVLDLFAGSGQLGLEALSRGAAEASFVDSSAKCVALIKKNAQKAKLLDRCKIYASDWSRYLSSIEMEMEKNGSLTTFDIVFLDPPYSLGDHAPGDCIKKLTKGGLLSEGALVICETGNKKQLVLDSLEGIESAKLYKYGSVYVTILKIKSAKTGEKNNV